MRPIDADALKDKLQQHHDFYVMAWGGFGKMSISEKKRVDEITNCIAEVVNFPTIEPKRGEWVLDPNGMDWNIPAWRCSRCGFVANYIGVEANGFGSNPMNWAGSNFCPDCGADMRGAIDGRTAD